MELEVRESEIEDVFAQYPELLKRVLGISGDMHLVARQKPLPSGRLDLMYAYANHFLLVELKAGTFKPVFVTQVLSYRSDLQDLQERGAFIRAEIVPYLLCPSPTTEARQLAENQGVLLCPYSPADVLLEFYRQAPLEMKYLSVLPTDKGVWRIGLTNESVALAAKLPNPRQIANARGCSVKTVGNQLRLAEELGLLRFEKNRVELSSFGTEFVQRRDTNMPEDTLSVEQAELIQTFVLSNPFFSGVTFGIFTIVSCVFELSRNTYPVPRSLLSRHFINATGLHFRWNREKAINKGVRMYSNYAIDLGLLGKIGNSYFVTPSGLRFVLVLNMHKSLKFIESIRTIS
ncbi:MAG: hypothetical protein ACRD4V_01555 [Candidatus Acidiferrales bacterium]